MCTLNEKYTLLNTVSTTNNCEVVLVESSVDSHKYLIKSINSEKNDGRHLDLKKRFCREMDIVASLDHPNIIKPAETYIEGNTFYIVYPYERGTTLVKLIDRQEKFRELDALYIMKQLLFAMEYIHAKGIIHADINPNNIFITEANKALLLDFGFSMNEEDARRIPEGRIIGTFPYLSPEQMGFTDFKIDTRTDLFCLLIVLYRMLAGKLPFAMQQATLKELLDATLKRNVSGIQHIPQYLNEVLIKGLRPSPADRYQTAEGLRDDLTQTAEMLRIGCYGDFKAGRKDALASINRKRLFVERGYELDLLQKGYQRLLKGKASSYLFYGKSGIGKTEIVKEFKTSIVPESTDFISVKCNRFVPSQPYSIVRQLVIEYLAQKNACGQDEIDSIKKIIHKHIAGYSGLVCSIIPEMRPWFDNVEAVSVIEKEREADRILHVLSLLVETLCKIKKIVVFIDDLQWVDKITFTIIEKVINDKEPCMMLCNYRTSENDETMYCFGRNLAQLSFSKIIPVREFGKDAITEVITGRFGIIKNVAVLVDTLLNKTDGVPFVVYEAVRYLISSGILVNDDGAWSFSVEALGDLPEKFDTVSLVLRKLDALDPDEKQVLTVASLIEGRFNNDLLSKLIKKTAIETKTLIFKFEQLGFIASDLSGGYVFIHDRIQESIASGIRDDERHLLYEQLAELYLEIASEDKERLFNAAECYLKTTNMSKAVEVSYKAAMYATEKVALDVAIRYFKNVLFIADKAPVKTIHPAVDPVKANIMFGNVLMLTGANEQALALFRKVHENCGDDRYVKLEVIYKIGCIYHNIGDFEQSAPYFIEALRTLGLHLPEKGSAVIFGLVAEVLHIVFTPQWLTRIRKVESDQWSLLKLRILNKLSYSMYFTHMIASMHLQFVANRYAASTIDSYEKAEAFAMHGIAAYQLFRKNRAFRTLGQAEKIGRRIERTDILAFSKSFGGLCRYYFAEWKKSESMLNESVRLFSSIGDVNNQIISAEHLWKIQLMRGNLDLAVKAMDKTIELCKKVNEKYFLVVTDAALNFVLLQKTGVYNRERYTDIVNRLEKVDSALFHLEAGGYILQAEIELGEYRAAYDRSMKLLPIIFKKCINSEYQVREYSQLCYLISKEMHNRRKGFRSIDVSAKTLLKQFIMYGCIHLVSCISFPAYKGAFYRNIAWFAAICNFKKIAAFFFKKAVRSHHSIDMRYEEACSLKDYGAFLDEYCNRPGEAHDQYAAAAELFGRCGAKMQVDNLTKDACQGVLKQGASDDEDERAVREKSSSSGINMLRFETLADVSKTITETDDPAILLRQILTAMITVTGAQYGCFFINRNCYGGYEPFAMSFEGNEVPLSTVPVFSDLIKKVNEAKTEQFTEEKMPDDEDDAGSATIRSDLCIPLNWREKYLGYVYLVNDRVKGLFGEGAQKSALILAAHAGILLENVHLMRKQIKFNEDLRLQVAAQTDDILQKKRQLEAANLKLIESERMKGILNGTIVHDIKNYAAGISGNLEYLNRRIENDPKAHRIIDVVSETCSDIASLASNLLDIAKMDDGNMVVRREILDKTYFEGVAEKFGKNTLFEEKEIIPSVKFSNDGITLSADAYLLERVLQNLYSNAAKYAPKGSAVELRIDESDDEYIVCFFNSGSPIPESEKEVVFEKYARLDNHKSQYSKGLGLFFCRMVMNAHNGRIWLDTDAYGNYFKLAFPQKHNILTFAAAS